MADDKRASLYSQIISDLIVADALGAISFLPRTFKWIVEVVTDFRSHLRGTFRFPIWSFYLLVLMSI